MLKLVLVFIQLLLFLPIYGAKIVVDIQGKGDFKSIQAAINAVQSGPKYTTIFIKNGIYSEKIFIEKDKHHLIFQGESTKGVLIQASQARDVWRCENPDDFGAATINLRASHVIFRNLTIINNYGFLAKADSTIACTNESGKSTISSGKTGYGLPREKGEEDGKKIVRLDGHQFAFRSMPEANYIKFLDCILRSGGGDTVSPWDATAGKYYFNNCIIEGHVDLYCPRGTALIENSLFICHSPHAGIWHDGSVDKNHKSVLINCRFEGVPDFKLGRYHRDSQMFLLDCTFQQSMHDTPIYKEGSGELKWGHRIFYYNCKKDGQPYNWYDDNFTFHKSDFKFKSIFGEKW